MNKPIFVILSGLPGVGKTTLAKMLSKHFGAVYIRVDSIEQAILNSSIIDHDVRDAGYLAGYLIARDNLSIGASVVADSVNSVNITRDGWRACADGIDCSVFELELLCSDENEHRKRVESRRADILNHKLPSWREVKQREYENWSLAPLSIDTSAKTIQKVYEEAVSLIEQGRTSNEH